MRVLFTVRLYSGLERGIVERRWAPTGVPAIYKMIEALTREPFDVLPVFTCKDYERAAGWDKDEWLWLRGLESRARILAGKRAIRLRMGVGAGAFREVRQVLQIWRVYRSYKPDVMYFDRANFLAAAVFARWNRTPVVLRLMGTGTKFMNEVPTGKRLVHRLARWAFRSPFAMVICTEDGSGVEQWTRNCLKVSVPRKIILNGVERDESSIMDPRIASLPEDRTIVVFVGRLEELKGCRQFLLGFLLALKEAGGGLHAVVVGTGSLSSELHAMVLEHRGEGSVTFLDQVPHRNMSLVYDRADIYVSLNRGGNLSNANLEAMKAGRCMIIPSSRPSEGVDVATDRLLPAHTACRIADVDDIRSLADAILHLHRNPREREARGQAIGKIANRSIPDWEERIESEIALVREIADQGRGRRLPLQKASLCGRDDSGARDQG